MSAKPATPEFKRGDIVAYVDHHGRLQTGEVRTISARWVWSDEPRISYDVHHPTYRNNRFYASSEDIKGLADV
jgi:hypothetical protein